MAIVLDILSLNLAAYIHAGDTILWGQAQAEPLPLTKLLMTQRRQIGNFNVFLGINNYGTCQLEHTDTVNFIGYCGAGNKALYQNHKLDILPECYSKFPLLIFQSHLMVDVVFIQVSHPNEDGQYSYSLAQDYLKAAIKQARIIIAEVNYQAPWVYSDDYLTEDMIDILVVTDRPINYNDNLMDDDTSNRIAQNVASCIEDTATLQFGIGKLADYILSTLDSHKDLGVHSGIINDGVADLMEKGIITNEYKKINVGQTVTGLINGTNSLHQFVHKNRQILLRDISYTHNLEILSKLNKFIAVNSAIEVDLTGQTNSELINDNYVGAIGGALDFARAANISVDGKSIIALPSTSSRNTRIVSKVQGAVTIPRSEVNLVITEYGVADLRGATLSKRVKNMISIAHPEHRDNLFQQAKIQRLI